MAIFSLPDPLRAFYKIHINYIEVNAVNPDKRRYAVNDEGARHFIDMDTYPDSLLFPSPVYWGTFKKHIAKSVYNEQGILPWHLRLMKYQLTEAFRSRNTKRIIKLSTEVGHYLGDANVPLHTTSNYNGQKTNQDGIHGFWESRLPELFSSQYILLSPPVTYRPDLDGYVWQNIIEAHAAVDSVLLMEKKISNLLTDDEKYTFEGRGSTLVKTYSEKFSTLYHTELSGMVERQMRKSIYLTATFWFSCWVEAGMPELGK
ncbi:MAG: zinc dependent phospholipase C family protein [Cyclobacteriaceae bacterium]|nr:zinc dependent phospholipase C family protein [Cyclobacteriaceae bacterium]